MKLSAKDYFKYGQIGLGLCLLICLFITPDYFFSFDQGGVSNYGTESKTQILFTLGFGFSALGSLLAVKYLPLKFSRRLAMRAMLTILAVLYLAVLATTYSYKINDFYRTIHEWSAIGLFVYMSALAIWLRFWQAREQTLVCRWFWLFVIGLLTAILTFFGVIHLLFTAQIISGLAFAMIVNNALKNTKKVL